MNNKATLGYYLALKGASCHLPKYGWTWTLCRVKLDRSTKKMLHNRRRKNDSEVLSWRRAEWRSKDAKASIIKSLESPWGVNAVLGIFIRHVLTVLSQEKSVHKLADRCIFLSIVTTLLPMASLRTCCKPQIYTMKKGGKFHNSSEVGSFNIPC